ncbi:hypothetical protein ACJ41O_007063 [Fusarium nematophilum]
MLSRQTFLSLLPLLGTPVLADFLGPRYPPPSDITSKDSFVAAGWENFTSAVEELLKVSATEDPVLASLRSVTFSVGVFGEKASSELQFHYSSPETKKAKYGTKKVDGDSIYGIASITKLFTVYAGLLNLDETDWERPLTYFFPQLADTAKKAKDDPARYIQWDKITPLALASQIGGVPRDGWPLSPSDQLLNLIENPEALANLGLPPLDIEKDPLLSSIPCNNFTVPDPAAFGECAEDPDNYLESQEERPPTFLPWTAPAYSNTGFMILGAILQNITGKSIDDLFTDSLFDPLDLSRTSTEVPPEDERDNVVIPGGNESVMALSFLASPTKSSGSLMSTTNDLGKLGVSILNRTLLADDVTRKWMKPRSHTSRLDYSIGTPWEIPRYVHPVLGTVTDLYTKSGDAALHSGFMAIIPEFGIGFSVLVASSDPSIRLTAAASLSDLVVELLMPALWEQVALEAENNFAGTYVSAKQGLNSSITITRNKTEGAPPGLTISSFISNGSDYLGGLAESSRFVPNRLVPTVIDEKSGKIAMRALSNADAPKAKTGIVSAIVPADWMNAGGGSYGAMDTGLYLFDVDEDGKAVAVSPLAFRTKLEKEGY